MEMSSGMARTPLKKETAKDGTAWFRCDQNNACGRKENSTDSFFCLSCFVSMRRQQEKMKEKKKKKNQ